MVLVQFEQDAGGAAPPPLLCLDAVRHHFDRRLVSPQAERELGDCIGRLPSCGVVGFEHRLHTHDPRVDVSVRMPRARLRLSPAAARVRAWVEAERLSAAMLEPGHHIKAIDLEFDLPACLDQGLPPRVFLQTTSAIPTAGLVPLARLVLGREPRAEQRATLRRCADALVGSERVLHVFAQFDEGGAETLHTVVTGLAGERLIAYLRAIDWPGDLDDLVRWLDVLEPLVDNVDLVLSIGDRVAARLGLELYIAPHADRRSEWERLFASLCAGELCLRERAEAVLAWSGPAQWPEAGPWQVTRFRSHLKLGYDGERARGLKAYVGVHTRLAREAGV